MRKFKFVEGWIESLHYYQASDDDRHKITASYNKRFRKLSDEGYAKRESDDFKTRLVGIRQLNRLWKETAEYDKLISRVAFIEFWDEARKELMKSIKEKETNEKKKP